MALSYEFSIGSVRAKENSMLSGGDVEHMLSCKSVEELCRFLRDKGYGEGSTIEEIINSHTKDMWNYLKSVAPDFSIFEPFIFQNNIHNLKVVLKGTMAGRKYESLLLSPCTIDADILKKAVENRKFNLLPDYLCEAADKAYDVIAHTGDARYCDALIDNAAMTEMLAKSEKFGSEFLNIYFRTLVFYNNIKIAIRSSRTGTSRDYLNNALCDVADFRKSTVIDAALRGSDALIDTLSKFSEYDCKNAISEYNKSPSAFEKFVDDRLIKTAREYCKRASEGAEPLMGYYLGNEAEKKVIHIIASGLRTMTDSQLIRERLREIYD